MKRLLYLLPLLALGALSAVFLFQMLRGADPTRIPSALIGRAAPVLDLPGVAGRPGLTASDLRSGEVAIVNFWASWCAPCRIEHRQLRLLKERSGARLYGINYKDKPEAAAGFLDELGDPFDRIGADANGRAAIEWGVYGVPETFIVAGDGRIVWKHVGEVTPQAIEQDLLPAIAKARSGAAP